MDQQSNENLLSIITVSFNSQETIRETLDSIQSQLDTNFEYIIIDGGSSDSTLSIIEEYGCVDILVSEPDMGIYDGMNKGIAKSSGRFIGFLNSDDLFASKDVTLELINKIKTTETDLIYGDIRYFENTVKEITRTWRPGEYKKGSFNRGWHPPHPAFYASKDLFSKSGNFDLDLQIAADFELMLRFFNYTKKDPIYVNKDFVLMREGGASHSNRLQGNKDVLNAFKKNNIKINKLIYLWRRLAPKFIYRYIKYPLQNIFRKH
tara:strand:+ start:17796 stop:18584 length:789 start_codon:yes stop_codon:yes gene_type:complete